MQISLVQAEINAAIVNYINSQVNIKEGMQVGVEISATRGESGFTATIEIAKVLSPRFAKVMEVKEHTEKTDAVKFDKPEAVATPAAEPTKEEPEPQAQAEKPATVEQARPVSLAAALGNSNQNSQPPVNPLASQATKPRSLFEGINKPTN